ncbi:MAG: NAD(P)/FAD-dependent oxidoreductase [Candidatus Aminicenantes bacterium]|nr:NAD(P)/FAD-dependent oxidoreductase [Candidatus Aminicenantes bacterium]
MRVIVVGNGVAATIFAKSLRESDSTVDIDIFAKEKYHYYPRPNLIDFLAGRIPFERIFAFPEEWYAKQNLSIHLRRPVRKIHPGTKEIEFEGAKTERYDKLFLANGSNSFVPPFKGTDKRGVFSLWTIDDAYAILEYLTDHRNVVVIGGGLLGLEIAWAVKSREADVRVVEFFDRLLPRQLDAEGASILQGQIEKMGIKVRVGAATEEILGEKEISGLRFKGDQTIDADMGIVAAGSRPNLEIARGAGLETDKGIVVDDYLQTSDPDIFAAGDVVQHQGRVYGIIPASFEQARIAAANILGQKKQYKGTIPSNTLKVVGIFLTSIGLVNPEKGDCEEFRAAVEEEGIYKKIVIKNSVIVGAIWMGTKKGSSEISRLISEKRNVDKWKDSLLEDDFDYSVI